MHNVIHKYSGVVINQNQIPATPSDFLIPSGVWVIQDFFLPSDYRRGTNSGELRYPDLSGIQIMVGVTDALRESAQIEYKLEYQIFGAGWTELTSGTTVGTPVGGNRVWMNLYFNNPVEMDEIKSKSRMRIQLRPSLSSGVTKLWFARPNPLATLGASRAYAANGTTPLTQGGEQYSFNFRILGLVAEDGVDFLGNTYRSVVVRNKANLISTAEGADADSYWLSKPNPSKFAVESLYFDMRANPTATHAVVDRLLIDPITPGVYFAVYYSNEGERPTTEAEWENKLWVHVPRTYRAERRETHVLPEPISARFMKIEFSHLQARHYAPGNFAQSIQYKKHPKWVLDYFLARTASAFEFGNPFLAESKTIIFDALDLAYNYYLDDINQEPLSPVEIDPSFQQTTINFLNERSDAADQVDPVTLQQISLVLDPYRSHPALRNQLGSLLSDYARATTGTKDYVVEQQRGLPTTTSEVSVINRDRVVFEQSYPVMFFYLTCRHAYRVIEANFTHDRAYFAGVRELAFLRDNYMVAYDNQAYIEPGADTLNIERNDFQTGPGGVLGI